MLSASLQSTWDTQRARQKQPKYGAAMYQQNNPSMEELQQQQSRNRAPQSLFSQQQNVNMNNRQQQPQDFNTTQYSELPNLRNPQQQQQLQVFFSFY
jgi:hypothetical protein